jgi:TolB protein
MPRFSHPRIGLAVGVAVTGSVVMLAARATPAASLEQLAYSAPDGIHLINVDGTEDKVLPVSRAGDSSPTWSPDGTRLAVVAQATTAGYGRLYVLDLSSGARTLLSAAGKTAEAPSWSYDGATIYYDDARLGKLYSIRPDGTARSPVLENEYGYYPAAGPDGTLAYTNDDGVSEVYVTAIPPVGDLPGIPAAPVDSWGPAWWPDGASIAYMFDRAPIVGGNGGEDSRVEIFRISKGTDAPLRLTHDNVWDGDPSISPDGSLVAFDTGRWGWLEVAIMNADGSNRRRLTFELHGDAETPAWRPAAGT